jgi:uncharacterized membrane protein required for colicin V production
MGEWNGIDFFVFLIFFLNLVIGMSRGATKEIISFMCLCVAVIFTIKFTMPITTFLNSSPLVQKVLTTSLIQNFMNAIGAGPLTESMLAQLAYCLSIVICFSGVFCACEAALSFTGFIEAFSFPFAALNRKVGATLGCIRGYVLVLIFILILLHLYQGSPTGQSYFVNLFRGSVSRLDALITGQQVERYQEIFRDQDLYNEKEIYKMFPNPTPNQQTPYQSPPPSSSSQ